MTRRKRSLVIVLLFLCVVYAFQLALSSTDGVQTVAMGESPDKITVSRQNGESFTLEKRTDSAGKETWIIQGKNYESDSPSVAAMLRALGSLKIIGTVSSHVDDERFGLDAATALSVDASAHGGALLSLKIGKVSPAGSQTYVVVDGEKGVRLVSGNIRDVFDTSSEELRNRVIFNLDRALVSRVSVENRHGVFSLLKSGEPPVWDFATDAEAAGFVRQSATDTEKTASWVSSVLSLTALSFEADSSAVPEGPAVGSVVFSTADGDVSLSVYASGYASDGSRDNDTGNTYLAVSSASPYVFRLSSYTAERYLKDPADFLLQSQPSPELSSQ